jgi:hypothetical protein
MKLAGEGTISTDRVCEVIAEVDGNATHAARRLRVSHRQMCRWARLYPEIKQALDQARTAPRLEQLLEGVEPGTTVPLTREVDGSWRCGGHPASRPRDAVAEWLEKVILPTTGET